MILIYRQNRWTIPVMTKFFTTQIDAEPNFSGKNFFDNSNLFTKQT